MLLSSPIPKYVYCSGQQLPCITDYKSMISDPRYLSSQERVGGSHNSCSYVETLFTITRYVPSADFS